MEILLPLKTQKKKGDRSNLVKKAKSVLAAKLDREKGHEVTQHEVFLKHAQKYEREFMQDLDDLKIRKPDVLTRVTEYIPEIIAFIEKLVEKGTAYASNGSVYLSLPEFKKNHNYRKLSPSNEEASEAEMAESEGTLGSDIKEKRYPNDFALWKGSKPGEPAWNSPWGQGRPGWHIECSVVVGDILGSNIDIHSGGEDLKFPHHDNELAQSESYFENQQWVNYFTHTGHLHIKGLKMSKSLKNFITIRQALENQSPRQFRILFLLQPWYDQMQFSDQTVEDCRVKEATFKNFFQEVESLCRKDYLSEGVGYRMGEEDRKLMNSLLEAQNKVHNSLLDNFNTKDAMYAMLKTISDANVYLRLPNCKPAILTLRKIANYVTHILKCFGVIYGNDEFGMKDGGSSDLGGSKEEIATPYIDTFVEFRESIRTAALNSKDKKDPAIQAILQACDEIRDNKLVHLGVRLEDRNEGSKWNLEDPKVLLKEREEKNLRILEIKREKAARKIEKLQKDLEKFTLASRNPKDIFKTNEYTAWDEETGLPVKLADGKPVSDSALKKLKKLQDKQAKAQADLLKKSGGNIEDFINKINKEIEQLQIN